MDSPPAVQSHVLRFREDKRLTQEELAKQCGLTRQAVSAIEAGAYFPNSVAALRMAKALECRVEDLFTFEDAARVYPVTLVGRDTRTMQRVNVVKVRKKVLALPLTPQHQLLEGFASANGVLEAESSARQARLLLAQDDLDRTALMVGCDPGLSIVSSHLTRHARDVRLIIVPGSSQAALDAVRKGEAHLAGTHLPEASGKGLPKGTERALAKRGGLIVAFARWEQGLMVPAGNPKGIKSIDDLARRDIRFVNRETGSGSRSLLEHWLKEAGIPERKISGFQNEAAGHFNVAHTVLYGGADTGVGLRAIAEACGLDFIPISDVRFDFVIPKDFLDHPAVSALMNLLNSRSLRAELSFLPGYDVNCMGDVIAKVPASSSGRK